MAREVNVSEVTDDGTKIWLHVAPSVLFSIKYSLTEPVGALQVIAIEVFAGLRESTPTEPGAAGAVVAETDELAAPIPTSLIAKTR